MRKNNNKKKITQIKQIKINVYLTARNIFVLVIRKLMLRRWLLKGPEGYQKILIYCWSHCCRASSFIVLSQFSSILSVPPMRIKMILIKEINNCPSDTGSTYIRWGRKQCPDNQTEMVYSGELNAMVVSEFTNGRHAFAQIKKYNEFSNRTY